MQDGILVVNKPQNMTSFDAVAILRKRIGIKRVGHFGTLDPMAEGVLPIAVGKATRLMDYTDNQTKEYIATCKLGITTDTLDITGRITEERQVGRIEEGQIESALMSFLGESEQIPPIYSALKVNGRRLYEYARAGEKVEPKGRKIHIDEIELICFGDREKTIRFRVVCGKGTYIRSLIRDLGAKLGCGATMTELIRTRSGPYAIEDSITIDEIKESSPESILERILPMETAIPDFGEVHLPSWESRLFENGVALRADQWQSKNEKEKYKVFNEDGHFVGVGIKQENNELKAHKVLK